jgi:hypothetical protein
VGDGLKSAWCWYVRSTGLFGAGSLAYSFLPHIVAPIVNAGANKATLDASRLQKDINIAIFEKTIQTAFREVGGDSREIHVPIVKNDRVLTYGPLETSRPKSSIEVIPRRALIDETKGY